LDSNSTTVIFFAYQRKFFVYDFYRRAGQKQKKGATDMKNTASRIIVLSLWLIVMGSARHASSAQAPDLLTTILQQFAAMQAQLTAIQNQLNGVPPGWYQTLPADQRFVSVLTNGEGVLDKETGLVWQKAPSSDTLEWINAHRFCNSIATGGRLGWRLPTLQELASLLDRTQSSPALPSGHPFTQVSSAPDGYWSANLDNSNTGTAWGVAFGGNGSVFHGQGISNPIFVWCVRGGQGVDPQ
jgi:hypothetical protein